MKVTVCEISTNISDFANQWHTLVDDVKSENSHLVVLPEMGFSEWFPALETPIEDLWNDAVANHERWLETLDELNAGIVIGSKPTNAHQNDIKHNVGYIWTKEDGIVYTHSKYYLPNEEGFWEANWYSRGIRDFELAQIKGIKFGLQICSELWFMEHTRNYSQDGIDILVVPRSTPMETNEKWLTGGRTAGVIGGCFTLSSNHKGLAMDNKTVLGGQGWITDPEGLVVGITSEEEPVLTRNIDITESRVAKSTYPRYITS